MNQDMIKEANFFFKEGSYDLALKLYEKINDKPGIFFGALDKNIDVCRKKLALDENIELKELPSLGFLNKTLQIKNKNSDFLTRKYYGSIRPKYSDEKEIDLEKSFTDMYGGYPLHLPQSESPKVSIIIPVYKGREYFENCLRSLAVHMHTEPSFEVIALDDCPQERVLWAIPQSGGVTKINNEVNLGFLLNCNKGATYARGEYLCFLNSDTLVTSGWLTSLIEAIEADDNVGIVGSMLLNNNGTIQDAGWRILKNGWGHPIGKNSRVDDGTYTYKRQVDCVTGACFIIKNILFRKIGGFDPHYAPAFYEEFDLAFRLRKLGYKTIYQPRSRVLHLGSASYGAEKRDELSTRNHKKFCLRYRSILNGQPINVNESLLFQTGEWKQKVILIVDFDVPQPDRHAGDVTMTKYINSFIRRGLRIIFFPNNGGADGKYAEDLEEQGIQIIKSRKLFDEWIEKNGQYIDYIFTARPDLTTDLLSTFRGNTNAKIIYYTHDLHFLRLEREADLNKNDVLLEESKRVKHKEINIFRDVDLVLSPSELESNLIKTLTNNSVQTVLPYFYNEAELSTRSAEHFSKCNDIIFVGGFPHTPNVDAAVYITNNIMPLIWSVNPDIKLYLVGYSPPPEVLGLASKRIIVTGQVADLSPYYQLAKVVLCALRYGAGVKGKTIDALRMGVPVVGTPIAFEGIPVVNNENVIIRNTPQEICSEIISFFNDNLKCERYSIAGVQLIREHFSINSINAMFDNVLQR